MVLRVMCVLTSASASSSSWQTKMRDAESGERDQLSSKLGAAFKPDIGGAAGQAVGDPMLLEPNVNIVAVQVKSWFVGGWGVVVGGSGKIADPRIKSAFVSTKCLLRTLLGDDWPSDNSHFESGE